MTQAALIARLFGGPNEQAVVVDYLTTPALVFYVITLSWDFYVASVNGRTAK